MGIFFSKKKSYWVPEHRKMLDKIEDQSKWKPTEDMTGWQLQNSLADKLGDAIVNSKQTVEINLSFNGLGDDECQYLAKAIKDTRTIKRLILENNHIHPAGAIMLAEALTPGKGQDDPVLEELDLCNNSIGAEGATAVASVLTSNKTLKKINLFWNNIGNEGLQAICANLRKDFPLDFVLDVRYNGFDRGDNSVDWANMSKQLSESKVKYIDGEPGQQFFGWPES